MPQDEGILTGGERARFRELRRREEGGTLTEAERAELQTFFDKIEAMEAAYLHPANARLAEENARLAERAAALQGLLRRQELLAQKLEAMIAEVDAERRSIREERRRVLGRPRRVSRTR